MSYVISGLGAAATMTQLTSATGLSEKEYEACASKYTTPDSLNECLGKAQKRKRLIRLAAAGGIGLGALALVMFLRK